MPRLRSRRCLRGFGGELRVVRVDDVAELRELGEERPEIAVLVSALEHADRAQRPVRPMPEQTNVGETRPHARSGPALQLRTENALLLLKARQERDHRRLHVVEETEELVRRRRSGWRRRIGGAASAASRGLRGILHGARLSLDVRKITTVKSIPRLPASWLRV